jgi:hypothetical protein
LKRRAPLESQEAQIKVDGFAIEKAPHPLAKCRDGSAGSRPGIREGHLEQVLRQNPLIGEKHATHLGPGSRLLPDDAQRAESGRHAHVREEFHNPASCRN